MAGGALAVAILAWLVHSQLAARSFDWKLAGASLARLRWHWLAISLVPIFGTYYGRALRWAVFLKPLKPHPSISGLTSATVIGFTAITLFGRPGEFIRPYLIAVKERVPVTSQLAAWLLERIFDLLMCLLVFAFALTRVRASGVQASPRLEWFMAAGGRVVGLACVALLVLLMSFRHFTKPLEKWLTASLRFLPARFFHTLERWIGAFIQGVGATRSDRALILVFLYSTLEWLLIAACYWCLAQACPWVEYFTFVDILIFMGFVSFGAAFQIPGIGGGFQVVAVVVLTELFGLRLELAVSFAFLSWFITFVAIVPLGLILALKEGLDWHGALRAATRMRTEASS